MNRTTYRISRRSLLQTAGVGTLAIAGATTGLQRTQPLLAQTAAGERAQVYPAHGTATASPHTEISFRGASIDAVQPVIAIGSQSGGHAGVYKTHSDGHGVSFLPDVPFQEGESVTLRAGMRLMGEVDGAVTFTIARAGLVPRAKEGRETEQPETPPQEFRSRPDLLPPVMNITTPATDTAPGYLFVGAKIPDAQHGAMIFDDRGEIIWFAPPTNTALQHNDIRVQTYRGEPVLTFWEGISEVGYGLGHFVMLDSSYHQVASVRAGNGYAGGDLHEFLLTPGGTALIVVYNPVRWGLTSIGGPENGTVVDGIIQEIDIETDRVLFEWHSLDHIDVDESYSGVPAEEDALHDYLHLNSIEDDGNGNLVISARHTHAVYKIDRATGEIVWRLNGKENDFELIGDVAFAYQHDPRLHPGGMLTLFDNAAASEEEGDQSRGLMLDLDEDAMTATLVREYIHPDGLLAISQANVQMVPNGNALIGWGSAPATSEFGPDGELRFDAHFPQGGTSYRAYRFPWIGEPSAPPDLAVRAGFGTTMMVYASWNGATEVASWRVLAGAAPDNLQVIGEGVRTGFETEIVVETDASYIAVEALDASGTVLGTSDAVEKASL